MKFAGFKFLKFSAIPLHVGASKNLNIFDPNRFIIEESFFSSLSLSYVTLLVGLKNVSLARGYDSFPNNERFYRGNLPLCLMEAS